MNKRIRTPKINLNPQQAIVVAHNEGPALVSAGPGSGKTRCIVERITRMINDNTCDPERILATTFTRKAANEMNSRLEAKGINIKRMAVQTTHSYCYRLIRQSRKFKGWKIDERDVAKIIIKNAIGYKGLDWKADISLIEQFIAQCRNTLTEPADCAKFLEGQFADERYGKVYVEYDEELASRRLITMDDMLYHGVRLLQFDKNVRTREQGRFEYVMVDELQDSNVAQTVMADLVAAPEYNLMGVGDVDQCHPPTTKILTDDGYTRIDFLRDGDTVKGWNRNAQKMIGGRKIRVSARPYDGNLISMNVGTNNVDMTPNHRVLVRWTNPEDRETCVVYLMYRKEYGYRIGWCQLLSNSTNTFHLKQRARLENADKVWILTHTKDRTVASVLESIYSVRFGIPTTPFEPVHGANHLTREAIDLIFGELRSQSIEGAKKALTMFGLSEDMPLLPWPTQIVDGKSDNEVSFRRSTYFPVYAINLIPGLMSVPLPTGRNKWEEIYQISYKPYNGLVYSLDVEKDHSYAADGVVVLNCIYEWRGAVPQSMIDFEHKYNAKVITLGTNYRCAPAIVDAASKCIEHNKARISKELSAARSHEMEIVYISAGDTDDEAAEVREQIQALLADGMSPGNMIVLMRTNSQSRALEEELIRHKIPFVVLGSVSFYERKEIKALLSYLRLLVNPGDIPAGELAINRPFRFVGKKALDGIRKEAHRLNHYLDGIKRYADSAYDRSEIGFSLMRGLEDFYTLVERFNEESSPSAALREIVQSTDFIDYLVQSEGSDTLESSRALNVGELIASASRFDRVDKFIEHVDLQIKLRKRNNLKDKEENRVQIMTIHKSKGTEAPCVFVIGANESLLPHAYGDEEEERRLWYVAITRAKDYLCVTSIGEVSDGIISRPIGVSRFVSESGIPLTPEQNGTMVDDPGAKIESTEEL
jgi:DNA helicase-2/ATP-dependent DNA helicase PcrA